MHTVRQKRQSCEACRNRKLKCTGDGKTCPRCASLNVTCTYQYMGVPGRPRKQRRPDQRIRSPYNASAGARSPLSPAGLVPSPPNTHPEPDSLGDVDDAILDLGSLPLFPPDFTTAAAAAAAAAGDFGCLPLELLSQCHDACHDACHDTRHGHEVDLARPAQHQPLSPDQLQEPEKESCSCADDVTASIRALRHCEVTHAMLRDLRLGVDLMERLLTCSVCYNLSKPPRLTIQNVLLIGRLAYEVTTGYRRHLRWVQETWGDPADSGRRETVHIVPRLDNSTTVGIQVSSRKFVELLVDGLEMDTARLTELGSRFALRQYNRHIVGHELCPDSEGRCWRERYDIDTDPLDICPKNAESRTLIPCFRVVDAVRVGIKAFVEELGRASRSLGA